MLDQDYLFFVEQIYRKLGIDLSLYKENQMKRRLKSLYEKNNFKSFTEYFHAIDKSQQLLSEFSDRMTINVTEFFRNQTRWDVLQTKILPLLMKNRSQLKVWSAASSTGEEPYTIAMLLDQLHVKQRTPILATDIDQNVLDIAKAGIYPLKTVGTLKKEYKDKYFEQKEGLYHVKNELKNTVQFKTLNLLADRYPTDLDLIVCRNVLIYFTEEAKDQLYQKFADALRPGGILFVGSTEQIFNPQKYNFEVVDTFFYQKV